MASPLSSRRRLSSERGMSLVEILVGIPAGIVLLSACLVMLNGSFRQSAKITDRIDAVQRGRAAMERVTRDLHSQVCPSTTGAAITSGTDNSVTFFTDLTGGDSVPEQRTITYDSNARTLTKYDYVASSGTWPAPNYPSSATRTSVLLPEAVPVTGTPFFSYYAYTTTGTITPSVRLNTPLSDADKPRVVKVAVSFVSQPTRTRQAPQATTFQSEVTTRTADANKPTESTRCL